jgi:group I intron endonuclease
MKPFVYKWTELSTGKWYIGSRTAKGCHPNDGYVCSSKIVRPLIKANPEDWTREILFVFDGESSRLAVEKETELLQKLDAKNDPMSYNRYNGDGVWSRAGKKTSEETKAKMSAVMKGRKHSEESKAKISAAKKGRKPSEENKAKLSVALKGRVFSEEWRQKISAANEGKKRSEQQKAKMGLAWKGKKHSEETKGKISAANKGHKVSEETRAKIKAAWALRSANNKKLQCGVEVMN